MKPQSFKAASARARFCTVTIGTYSSAPEADLASTPVASGLWRAVVTTAVTAKAAAVRRIAPTLCGSVIWSSTSTMPAGLDLVDFGRGQRVGLRQQTLMHGVRAEAAGDRIGPHQISAAPAARRSPRRGGARRSRSHRACGCGAADFPAPRDRVPAVKNDRIVRPVWCRRKGGRSFGRCPRFRATGSGDDLPTVAAGVRARDAALVTCVRPKLEGPCGSGHATCSPICWPGTMQPFDSGPRSLALPRYRDRSR